MRNTMLRLLAGLAMILPAIAPAYGQTGTYAKVYNTLQTSCTFSSCHSSANKASGLDLEGIGGSKAGKMISVYQNLVDHSPYNSYAASKGYKLVFPGDPYRSSLFRKAHGGLADEDIALAAEEGDAMPQAGVPLESVDAERIRQWILFGAPMNGEVVKDSLLEEYYKGNGMRAVKERPAAPAAGKGFQVHLGPFFLPPTKPEKRSEIEYFYKYATQLPKGLEVTKIEPYIGSGYSHHFILYKYEPGKEINRPYGLRLSNGHAYVSIVSAHQDGRAVELPKYTAFQWPKEAYLDLNTHYINYSSSKVLACEVYLNIYTQDSGTAKQVMYTTIVPNPYILIPNDSLNHTFSAEVYTPDYDTTMYIWALGCHTHQWGKDYDIFLRNRDGSKGDQVYDGSCKEGLPGCFTNNYDYQHPPARFFQPFLPVHSQSGFIHTATYRNTGPKTVQWGEKSEDEMMVMAAMYTLDTAGLNPPMEDTTNTDTTIVNGLQPQAGRNSLPVLSPNPFSDYTVFSFQEAIKPGTGLYVYDMTGKEIWREEDLRSQAGSSQSYTFRRKGLPAGIYIYKLMSPGQGIATGKLLIR